MQVRELHPWAMSPAEAIGVQRRLAALVVREDAVPPSVRSVAGADLSPPDADGVVTGAVVVLTYPELEVAEVRLARGVPPMPYVPGLLSFRESPVLLEAFRAVSAPPDLVLVDGQGIAHPRRLGIAAHLGVLLDVPTIGCAKSILRGRHGPLGEAVGSWAELVNEGEVVGAALRTRAGVSPVYVSIGHKVDLAAALRWTLACCQGYRMPEPTRLAHWAAAGKLPQHTARPRRLGGAQGRML